MTSISAAAFRASLTRDLPHVLDPSVPMVPSSSTDQGETVQPRPKAKKEQTPVNLLATNDTVVRSAYIADVAHYIHDTLGYHLLSNITAVDYLAEHVIELVYHFVHLAGGPPLVVKTRLPRAQPVVPSLAPFWPGASLQEREAYDLYGVDFAGHPDLRRVYMWDEFEGFPMRKDFPKQGDKYFASGE